MCSEHIYWDQATALAQLGLLDASLPVLAGEQCDPLLNRGAEFNRLIKRAATR